MTALRLISPSREFEPSYRSLVAEIKARGERPIPFPLGFPHDDFDELIVRLEQSSKGHGLPEGFVPNSTFWVVTQSEIVGVSNVRHSLTPRLREEGGNIGYGVRPSFRGRGLGVELLRQTLGKARDLGLTKVLLTCGKDNIASVRVILSNGGALESEEYLAARGEVVQRYWIDLTRHSALPEVLDSTCSERPNGLLASFSCKAAWRARSAPVSCACAVAETRAAQNNTRSIGMTISKKRSTLVDD